MRHIRYFVCLKTTNIKGYSDFCNNLRLTIHNRHLLCVEPLTSIFVRGITISKNRAHIRYFVCHLKLLTLRVIRFSHSLNIPCMSRHLLCIGNHSESRLVQSEQEESMKLMSVTLAVLKLLTSGLIRPGRSRNIHFMSVTLDVLDPLTSRLVRPEQLVNM